MFYVPLKPLKVLMTQDDRHGQPGGTLSKAGCGPALAPRPFQVSQFHMARSRVSLRHTQTGDTHYDVPAGRARPP